MGLKGLSIHVFINALSSGLHFQAQGVSRNCQCAELWYSGLDFQLFIETDTFGIQSVHEQPRSDRKEIQFMQIMVMRHPEWQTDSYQSLKPIKRA